ncbi:MAG: hypothetical protein LBL69_02970 [Zoogloeaceae bacterium]|nr:hypothetical protein [Zoogloeaceae bacterium]
MKPGARSEAAAKPHCRACRHYYIVHDPEFPYGCRAFGFKSCREPCRDVEEADGASCYLFEPKSVRK